MSSKTVNRNIRANNRVVLIEPIKGLKEGGQYVREEATFRSGSPTMFVHGASNSHKGKNNVKLVKMVRFLPDHLIFFTITSKKQDNK